MQALSVDGPQTKLLESVVVTPVNKRSEERSYSLARRDTCLGVVLVGIPYILQGNAQIRKGARSHESSHLANKQQRLVNV